MTETMFVLILIIGVVVIDIVVAREPSSLSTVEGNKYPCAFIDTINITDNYYTELSSTVSNYNYNDSSNSSNSSSSSGNHNLTTNQLFNNSFMYEWMLIPSELIGVYDFVIENGIKVPAVKHLRACICKLKPCIRFCCPSGQYYDLINKTCHSMTLRKPTIPILEQNNLTIQLKNGSKQLVPIKRHFIINYGRPCENMHYVSNKQRYITWTLHENGTIAYKNYVLSNYYCFNAMLKEPRRQVKQSHTVNNANNMVNVMPATWHWQPLACVPNKLPFILGVKEWTYAICLILTIICMIIILSVYILCTELKNTFFGVAIKAYTLCIIIGYSLLTHLTLTSPNNMSKYACAKIPSFILLYLVLSFYILALIGCNFYLNIHGIILNKLMFWFIFFPMVILAACWSFFVSYGHYNNKPIFGYETCWFDPRNYTIVMYFYVPILLACVFNGIFYILSLVKLTDGLTDNRHHSKTLTAVAHNRFKTFWKFFGYTLFTWLVCLASFTINYYREERSHINYVVAIFMAFHGFGSLYTLVGKNQQIQNFLRRMEDEDDSEEMAEITMPMSSF